MTVQDNKPAEITYNVIMFAEMLLLDMIIHIH